VFAASKSESLVTKSLVLKLSDERLDDWVRVLNMGSRKLQADAPLSAQDVRRIMHLGLVDVGSMYLELERALPTATARLQIVGRESATLNDFKTLPGRSEAGYELLNHILTICRKEKVLSVAAWVSQNDAHLSDMLASYTFVPRYIRTRMKIQLTTTPEDVRLDSAYVVEEHEGLQPACACDGRDASDAIRQFRTNAKTHRSAVGKPGEENPPLVHVEANREIV